MVQSTFTRQKRELSKAASLLERIRAQEVRTLVKTPEGRTLEESRDSYVDIAPEEIARQVFDVVERVVAQHGARQQANSRNTGCFSWNGVNAELTVPQLRALQDVAGLIAELVHRLPRRNPKVVSNLTVDGRPAFAHREVEHFRREVRYVPYEEGNTTRVRTYEEEFQILDYKTQTVEIDFGFDVVLLERLKELSGDLKTAIQVAIDDANAKGQKEDPVLEKVISEVRQVFQNLLPDPNSAKV
jgi:hypothetical protein